MINFIDSALFKLYGYMTISFRCFGDDHGTGGLLVQTVCYLRVIGILFGQAQNIYFTRTTALIQRGYKRRFIYNDIVIVFEKDKVFKGRIFHSVILRKAQKYK